MASADSDQRKAEATTALASAGGVEALQRFLSATPPCGGMAYVVIQHLSPEHKSLMHCSVDGHG